MKKPKYFGENEFQVALKEMASLLYGADITLPLENKNASYVNQDIGSITVDIALDGKNLSELTLTAAIKIKDVRVKNILVRGDKNTIAKWIGENMDIEQLRIFLVEEYKNIYMQLDRLQFDRD
jgi:hypothetical protein